MVINKKSLGLSTVVIGLLIWGAIYVSQKYSEEKLFGKDTPTKQIEGKVLSVTHIGKADWFDRYQVELTLDNDNIYLLYSDQAPQINKNDMVRLWIPVEYELKKTSKTPAISYEIIEKAPLNIQF